MSLHWRQIGLQEHNNYLCKRHISISDLPQSIAIYKHKIENEQFPWTNWIIIAETCNYWYKTKKDRLLLLLTYLISVLYWKNRNQNKCLCTWTFHKCHAFPYFLQEKAYANGRNFFICLRIQLIKSPKQPSKPTRSLSLRGEAHLAAHV